MKKENIIKDDLYRYTKSVDAKSMFKTFFFIHGFRFTYFMRKIQATHNLVFKFFYILIYRHYFVKYGIQIHYKTKIGKGLHITHFGGIVVNPNAILGENINLHHNVTIGQTDKGYPVIGNKVWIGTGSVIVGKIVIGDNVVIAPNSYVNFDVPSNSLVIMGEIKPRENASERYVVNLV